MWIHPTIFTLYTPPSSRLNTADANQLHAFRDLRSSLVVSSLHILNLQLFSRTAGGIKPDLYPCQQPSAEVTAGNMSHECPQLFSPRTRQFFARKVEVMREPLRAG